MKNICKYSFTILIMISCLITFTLFAVKTFFPEKAPQTPDKIVTQQEKPMSAENQGSGDSRKQEKPKEESAKEENPKADKPEKKYENPSAGVNFRQVTKDYLDDALFIGDSRTVGLSEYGKADNAAFFADTGMSVFNIWDKSVKVKDAGTVSLEKLLSEKQYGKIYLMIGINELGYNLDRVMENYDSLFSFIREKQPEAIIFVEANLHLTKSTSEGDKYFNNRRINKLNHRMAKYADNETSFYIDVNERFDSKEGNLKKIYSVDGTHLLGKYYKEWIDWILTKGV